ncbi:hypothetical protein H632_c358p1 [Helicosporidium sp. ATCC 50920]|nr:hypothetical protein H632_c358p1 [Helicosporidium sp. ATCC 50920]|eukprot:KDD76097.1 hypothetical protein H632_c358p1 [Helicosporidium sp. ATCC 50920]
MVAVPVLHEAEERSKWRRLERAEDDEDRRGEEEEEAAAKRALKEATEPEENEAMDVATSLVEEQPFRCMANTRACVEAH